MNSYRFLFGDSKSVAIRSAAVTRVVFQAAMGSGLMKARGAMEALRKFGKQVSFSRVRFPWKNEERWMMTRSSVRWLILAGCVTLQVIVTPGTARAQDPGDLTASKVSLGQQLFEDPNLAQPNKQSCASCHGKSVGFTGPISKINAAGAVMPGVIKRFAGSRKPPTVAYAFLSPIFDPSGPTGGQFWDGRASDLIEQAEGPFVNPVEMHSPDHKQVILAVRKASYATLFETVWNIPLKKADVETAYDRVARSIAAYEASTKVSPFNSKFDKYWRALNGASPGTDLGTSNPNNLSSQELHGLQLFLTKGRCSGCHLTTNGGDPFPFRINEPDHDDRVDPLTYPPVFTNHKYFNLGVPKNLQNPIYNQPSNPDGSDFIDVGVAKTLNSPSHVGMFKVPTLRNVAKGAIRNTFVKAYMHNGVFKSLEEVVHFYNKREDLIKAGDLVPEVDNVNMVKFIGNLQLQPNEEADIVAFLKTLSDE